MGAGGLLGVVGVRVMSFSLSKMGLRASRNIGRFVVTLCIEGG